ncbi:unnamed protein product [Symbiodinium sp. KB8]|nr:unnamed protein product [Symbiodinium sp. KB8]
MAKVSPVVPQPCDEPDELPLPPEGSLAPQGSRARLTHNGTAATVGASSLQSIKVGPVHREVKEEVTDSFMLKQLLTRKTSWVVITFLVVGLCYAILRPSLCSDVQKCQDQHRTASDLVPYSALITAALSAVFLHELATVILTYRTAKKALSLIPNIKESLVPSMLLCTTFAVLILENMCFFAGSSAWFAHASVSDNPDLDGMPVYTVFFAEWLINVPILIILAGQISLGRPAYEVSLPLVVTNVYMTLAWCANFIALAYVRYIVVAVSFLMYFKASWDMIMWVKLWRKDNPDGHLLGRPLLAVALVVVFGVYGIVYLLRLRGILPWHFEGTFYLTMNFTTKLCASMTLAGIRSSEFQEVLLLMLANTQTSFQRGIYQDDVHNLRD